LSLPHTIAPRDSRTRQPAPAPALDQNLLLRALPQASLERLRPHISVLDLAVQTDLYAPDDRFEKVYFPLTGVVSITIPIDGTQGEVATVGYEGMVGLPVVFGTNIAKMHGFMQIGGAVAAVSTGDFARFLDEDRDLRAIALRYAQALFVQIGQSVVCNQRHTLRQRCARWLLMTQDRAGDEFHLTHEFLAEMLGVRRAGVTVVAGNLQRAGLIRYRRGAIAILNRSGLERISCECYGVVRQTYERLMG
jgi:CRP-like cAMP-binding protein